MDIISILAGLSTDNQSYSIPTGAKRSALCAIRPPAYDQGSCRYRTTQLGSRIGQRALPTSTTNESRKQRLPESGKRAFATNESSYSRGEVPASGSPSARSCTATPSCPQGSRAPEASRTQSTKTASFAHRQTRCPYETREFNQTIKSPPVKRRTPQLNTELLSGIMNLTFASKEGTQLVREARR